VTIEPFADESEAIRHRPASFTVERAVACTPTFDISPEWKRKRDAGELPAGFAGVRGMLMEVPARQRMTREEAEWVLRLHATGTLRWVSEVALDDGNQITGDLLVRAAREVVAETNGGVS
jgi:hypothetical protein